MRRAPAETGFLGRSREVDVVRSFLDHARAGAGGAVLIEGEAGIGKSRLLAEAVAGERGIEVLTGAGEELERARPFAALAKAFGINGGYREPAAADFARLLKEAPPQDRRAQAPEIQFRILDAFMELAQRLSARGAVVLALEDLHWADHSTLLALRALARQLAHLRLAVIGTLRPSPRSPELGSAVAALLSGGGAHVRLGPLDSRAVSELVGQTVGARPGPTLLHQVAGAGGNPLFVLELLRALKEEGSIVVRDGRAEVQDHSLPPTLRLTILRRLGFLSADELHVLRVAAILGSQFSLADLQAVTKRTAVDLSSALQKSLDAGLVGEAGPRLAFRHDLVREAIYQDVPVAVRSGLHSEAGRALAEAGAPPGRVAVHLGLGASPGDAEAIAWLRRAAAESASRAPAVAVELLERALELTGAGAEADEIRAEIAPALVWSSRLEEGERVAREVIDGGAGAGGELRLALAQSLFLQGRLRESLVELEAAASTAPEDDRARLLAQTALGRMTSGDLDGALAAAEETRAAGEHARDDWALCIALYTVSYVAYLRGHIEEAVRVAEDAAAAAAASPEQDVRWREPRFFRGVVLMGADRFEEAEGALLEGQRIAEELGSVWDLPLYHLALSLRRFWSGEWDDAVAEAEAGLALSEDVGTRVGMLWPHSLIAHIAIHRDDLARAEEAVSAATRIFEAVGPQQGVDLMVWAQALLYEIAGNGERALALLYRGWEMMAAMGMAGQLYRAAPDLVRLALAQGDKDTARSVVGTVEDAAARIRMPYSDAAALRCRGLYEGDSGLLVRAVDAYRLTPRPVERAVACEDAGLALVEGGRSAEGVRLVEEALEVYERVGALRDAARAEAGLRRLGIRRGRRGARRRPSTGWESLTPTELEVVRLVGEGITNSEIGRRLFISGRTVQTHLSHVFAKLSMSSRAEVAAEGARRSS